MNLKNLLVAAMVVLPFFFPLGLSAQQARQQAAEAANQEALQRLWHQKDAQWEIRKQSLPSGAEKSLSHPLLVKDSLVFIQWMGFDRSGHPFFYQSFNLDAAKSIQTDRLWTGGLSNLNLEGEGITLNLWDAGQLRHSHQEFGDRTRQMDEAPYMHAHATHVGGTMVSAGINPEAKGMAPKARLDVYDFVNDETEMITAASEGAIISNHSYGRPTGWVFHTNQWWWYGDTRVSTSEDYKFGFYDEESQARDAITYHAPYYLQVHAAGNDRNDDGPTPGAEHNVFDHTLGEWVKSTDIRQPDGGDNEFDCISSLVLGKNLLTIGSVNDIPEYTGASDVELSEFSSMGPTDDGRIKPDLVANGLNVMSTWVDNNTSYAGLNGTSMAAPSISGSLGLLQEMHEKTHGNYMRASTLKALVIHTAREAGPHPGPDYMHGWGLPDFEAAARIIPEKDNTARIHEGNLVNNLVPSYSRQVYSTGQQPLVATLAWTDVPGTPGEPALNNRTPVLVNDLDLRITRLSDGEVFYPWRLDPDNPSSAATRGDNIVDNVENIEILLPEAGQYLVEVTHKGELEDLINENNKRQPFSLIVSGIAERNTDLATNNIHLLVSGCGFSEETPVAATISNNGRQTAENFLFSYLVKDALGNEVDSGSREISLLEAGNTMEEEFLADLTQGFEFTIEATVAITGDQLPANNGFAIQVESDNWVVSNASYRESFEEIRTLDDIGWQVFNKNSDNASWLLRRSASETMWASDGFNSMRYGMLNPGQDGVEIHQAADDYLVSTCFHFYAHETYRLTFDYRSWNIDHPESMRVVLGQSSHPDDLNMEIVDLGSFAMDEFVQERVQFTVEEDGTYFVGFHVYSPANHRFIYLDNVAIERMVLADIQATDLSVVGEGCDFDDQTSVFGTIFNAGENSQQNIPVELHVTHKPSEITEVYSMVAEGTIEPGTSKDLEFMADMSLYGMYHLQLIARLEGDERPENDTISVSVVNAGVDLERNDFFTNFDDINGLEEIDWHIINVNNDLSYWRFYRTSGQAHSPPNSMNYYRQDENVSDDWLITNCLRMEEGAYYRLRFQTATQITGAKEEFKLFLMSGTTPGDAVSQIGSVVVDTHNYAEEEFVFQAPYTGEFHLGFYVDYLGPLSVQFFVDDVHMEKVPDLDAAVVDVVQQTYGCNAFTENTPIQVVVKNRGALPLEALEVALRVESDEEVNTYTLRASNPIGVDETATLEFTPDLSTRNTIYTLTAKTLLEGDEEPSNDEFSTQVRNTNVNLALGDTYFNGFEMSAFDGNNGPLDPFTGWWFENTNDDYHEGFNPTPVTWRMRSHAPFAHSGNTSMRSGRSPDLPADDWLFSNCFYMEAEENYLVSFYYTGRQTDREEVMAVHLGTEQHSEFMDIQLWEKTFNTGIEYQEAVIAFSPPEDGTYYIGFHAKSEPNQGWIYMDDFSIQKNHDLDISLDAIEIMEEACSYSKETPARIAIRNSGNIPMNYPITVEYALVSASEEVIQQGSETVEMDWEPGEAHWVNILLDLEAYGIYSLQATASLPAAAAEPETGNNSRETEIFSTRLDPSADNLYLTFEEFTAMEDMDWTTVDANGDGFGWEFTSATMYAYSGSQVFLYGFNPNEDADDYLFSSCAHLKAGVVYNVGYSYRVFDGDYGENLRFGLAASPHPDAIVQVFETKSDVDNYSYRRVTYSFTVSEDGTYHFFWHANSHKNQRYVFMDDFFLRTAAQVDGGLHDLVLETSPCAMGENTTLKATLVNLGSESLSAGNLELIVEGPEGRQTLEAQTPAINAGEKVEVEMEANMEAFGRYAVDYHYRVEGDMIPSNNQGSRRYFNNRKPLHDPGSWHAQDFGGVFALREAGWHTYNLNMDDRYWGLRLEDRFNAYSGNNYLVYFVGNSLLDANDWAISNCFNLVPGKPYKVAFFYKLGSGEQNLKLAMGEGSHPDNMDQVLWEKTGLSAPEPNDFTLVETTIEVEEAGNVHFGIQQFSPAGQGSSIIDHLVVVRQPEIIPLDGPVDYGKQITLEALGTDSLAWYADEDLTVLLGRGTTLQLLVEETEHFEVFAAEHIRGVTGPAHRTTIQLTTGLDPVNTSENIRIYPNPVRNKLLIEVAGGQPGTMQVRIVDLMGRTMWQDVVETHGQTTEVDVGQLPPGAYIIQVTGEGIHHAGRFIKVE